jgi:hypothetical protein
MFHRISAREMIVMKTHIGLLNTTEEGGADVALLTPDFVNSFFFFLLDTSTIYVTITHSMMLLSVLLAEVGEERRLRLWRRRKRL